MTRFSGDPNLPQDASLAARWDKVAGGGEDSYSDHFRESSDHLRRCCIGAEGTFKPESAVLGLGRKPRRLSMIL